MTDTTASAPGETPPPAPNDPRCPRWVKIVLGLSLAVNLAIAGLVAGAVLRGKPMGEGRSGMGYAAPYVIALPKEDRRAVFGAIRSDAALPKRDARRAQYARMTEALRADPFDRARVQAILSEQGQAVARIQDAAQTAWLATVAEMSLPERIAYVEKVEKVLRRGGRGGRHYKDRERD